MKFLIIDDENELYEVMYADLFKCQKYDIEEISKFVAMPKVLEIFRKIIFDDRINRHFWIPGKKVWNKLYSLSSYYFDKNETYWVIFLNGTLRNYYSKEYLKFVKDKHSNVKLAMVMYDSYSNSSAQRAIDMIPVFDMVFSFDKGDCERHGLKYIYSTFSKPDFVSENKNYENKAFFVGAAVNRLDSLHEFLYKIASNVEGCEFRIAGVRKGKQLFPKHIKYNQRLAYNEALQYAYNSDCIVEIVRKGQSGVSLRTCEAVSFNKKLITNNSNVVTLPFYDSKYIKVVNQPEDIDVEFIRKQIDINYNCGDIFSPVKIIEILINEGKY